MSGPLSVHTGGKETLLPQNFRWPGDKRIAVFFRMAFEIWSDTRAEAAAYVRKVLKA